MLTALKHRLIAVLLCLDELLNVLLGPSPGTAAAGNPHYTVSQRLAEMRDEKRRIGCVGCALLTWIQNKIFRITGDHCTAAMLGFPQDLPTEG